MSDKNTPPKQGDVVAFPAGTVVFVPDGEPRLPRECDMDDIYCETTEANGSQMLRAWSARNTYKRQFYRRIVIGETPAEPKVKTVRERLDEMSKSSGGALFASPVSYVLADAIDAIEARVRGEK